MIKKLFILFTFSFAFVLNAQIVINEVDADNPGTDTKEFVELKSVTPNFSLNGYVLVFFNGNTNGLGKSSYFSIDLDGLTTDINGIIHIGNSSVSPTPAKLFFDAAMQNGPDGIGLYLGDATDFPLFTIATNTNLINGVTYTGTSILATELMAVFGTTFCPNDFQASNSISKSIQRKNDGTYEVKIPTPGVNNDGSGIVLNYVTTTTNAVGTLIEGQNLTVTFTTSQVVSGAPLVLNLSLDNGSFNSSDFSGNTTITIPVGSSSISTTLLILNDGVNDGDEELKLTLFSLPLNYSLFNNNQILRVENINFVVSNFGTPLNPTYGNVSSTAPAGYYSSIEGLSGATLKQALQDIIANPAVVHAHNYGDIYDILKVADQNPANSNKVWLMYVEQPRSKIDVQEGNTNTGKWNREHIYAQSRGGFADATSIFADGINIWLPTNANDILAGHADAHHLRAEDGPENTTRSNRNYGIDYNGPAGSQGSWRGDVARSLFYMAVRYNGLSIINGNPADSPTTAGTIGDLASLLVWNQVDPRDDFEMNRNNYIYTWQVNRNPFIDYPSLVNYIFGANYGQPWFSTLANTSFESNKVTVYPNPAYNLISFSGLIETGTIKLYSVLGIKVLDQSIENNSNLDISSLSSGVYIVKIISDNKTYETKLFKN